MSMILKSGDIFNQEAGAIVNPSNVVGILGGGVALEFRKRFNGCPVYTDVCNRSPRTYYPGHCLGERNPHMAKKDHPLNSYSILFHLATKGRPSQPSRLEYVEHGLASLVGQMIYYDLDSVVIPALGCGLGGLDWEDVRPIMEKYLMNAPFLSYVFRPQ